MSWILFGLSAALFQAIGATIKKKSLQESGTNNLIGFVSFLTAGIIFGFFLFVKTGSLWPHNSLSQEFWIAMFWYVVLNIVGYWFMYRALDLAEFNHLMPFMTLTSLSAIIPPLIIFHEMPSTMSLLGIVIVVIGALIMNFEKVESCTTNDRFQKRKNHMGLMYFLATAVCFTINPTVAKITVRDSSVLFASFLVHVLIGLGFLIMALVFHKKKKISELFFSPKKKVFLFGIVLAGFAVALQNGSLNMALSLAPVASVVAINRTMPLFAFLIGVFYFKERTDLTKKIIATVVMVIVAMIVALS